MAEGGNSALSELFEPAEDERVVVSLCAARREGGGWTLVHGTLLVVPEECAAQSWAKQRREREGDAAPELPASLALSGEDWLLARQVIGIEQAEGLLEAALGLLGGEAELPPVGELSDLWASLGAPDLWRRVMPHTDTPTSTLITGLGRPVDGIFLPALEPPPLELPAQVEVEGAWSFLPAPEIAGIHVTDPGIDPKLASATGLLVGRAERRAWLGNSRGQGDFERFNAEVCVERDLIDVEDLELTHNEYLDGDLALSNRFRLTDEATGAAKSLISSIPTIGRKVAHELLLHTNDGELLDRSGPYPLIERVEVTISIDEGPGVPVSTGVSGPPPDIEERLQRSREVQGEIEEMRRLAAEGRILRDRGEGLRRVAELLGRARGELMVIDPFFGQHREEWDLLGELVVPARVVTAKIETDTDKEPVPVEMPAKVAARWRPKAPIHDRVYFWRGGGFWLGASLSTLGKAPVGTGVLDGDEAEVWSEIFEVLWTSPHLREVPRVPGT